MISLYELYKIKYAAPVPLSLCRINKRYLLEREGIGEDGSALLFLMPYYKRASFGGNVSMYAAARDYHLFFKLLADDLIPRLRACIREACGWTESGTKFAAYADHSPISEMYAAAIAGLGVLGENGLLINDEYSSFCFIGGIYSSIAHTEWGELVAEAKIPDKYELSHCKKCGACAAACPAACIGGDLSRCRSYITQKKRLDAGDAEIIKDAGYVWGCDICQNVCPVTRSAETAGTLESPIDFFGENTIPNLTTEILDDLVLSGEFEKRAFSWRGADVIMRNLKIKEGQYDADT